MTLTINFYIFFLEIFRWTFNAAVLTKVSGTTGSPTSAGATGPVDGSSLPLITVGSTVLVDGDLQRVKTLQRGHGEWADAMSMVCLIQFVYFNFSYFDMIFCLDFG